MRDEAGARAVKRGGRTAGGALGLVVWATLLLVAAPRASWAHVGPDPSAISVAPAVASLPASASAPLSPLLLLAAALAALGVGRGRRLVPTLVLLVLTLGFETQLHAVHHMDDPAAQCPVSAATAHLTGALDDGIGSAPSPVWLPYPVPPRLPAPVSVRPPAPHAGRAPPAPTA